MGHAHGPLARNRDKFQRPKQGCYCWGDRPGSLERLLAVETLIEVELLLLFCPYAQLQGALQYGSSGRQSDNHLECSRRGRRPAKSFDADDPCPPDKDEDRVRLRRGRDLRVPSASSCGGGTGNDDRLLRGRGVHYVACAVIHRDVDVVLATEGQHVRLVNPYLVERSRIVRIEAPLDGVPDCCINRRIRYLPDQTRSGLRENPSFPRKRE